MDLLKFFIENKKFDIFHRDIYGNNILHSSNDLEITKYLLSLNMDPNKPNKNGNNLLHISCLNKNLEMIKYLIEDLKIPIETTNRNGFNLILLCLENLYVINDSESSGDNNDSEEKEEDDQMVEILIYLLDLNLFDFNVYNYQTHENLLTFAYKNNCNATAIKSLYETGYFDHSCRDIISDLPRNFDPNILVYFIFRKEN